MIIRAIDNFLPENEFDNVLSYCKKSTYVYGETDNEIEEENDVYCIGMVHQIYPIFNYNRNFSIENKNQIMIIKLIKEECESQFLELNGFILNRMYINCFAPSENPYFHIDSCPPEAESFTCLYYVNSKWNLDDGGETQFYIDDNIYGVPPEPNRMVIFDGRIKHRATSFRNRHRFTIALKYVLPP
jgi:hypothetical protein